MKSLSTKEREYWVLLSSTPGIGPVAFAKLINSFGSAEKAWKASIKELKNEKISQKIVTLIQRRHKTIDPSKYYLSLIKKGFQVTCKLDADYPVFLKNIRKAPPVLYYKGSMSQADKKSIAVVGTRRPTTYGRQVAAKLVKELVAEGFTIVSGLARGIDAVAHRTTLENNGRTVGFLGGGIDNIYPAEHRGLAKNIIQRGAIISEFPPGLVPERGNFPARNRLISGMSLGVIIVEGLSKSGTKHTANHAIRQGKPVFAVPGPITSPLSDAPMDLLENGAIMVRKVDDILENLGMKRNILLQTAKGQTPTFESKEEEIIYKLINKEPMESNQLIRESRLGTTTTLTTLSIMEVKGIIKNLSGLYHLV